MPSSIHSHSLLFHRNRNSLRYTHMPHRHTPLRLCNQRRTHHSYRYRASNQSIHFHNALFHRNLLDTVRRCKLHLLYTSSYTNHSAPHPKAHQNTIQNNTSRSSCKMPPDRARIFQACIALFHRKRRDNHHNDSHRYRYSYTCHNKPYTQRDHTPSRLHLGIRHRRILRRSSKLCHAPHNDRRSS